MAKNKVTTCSYFIKRMRDSGYVCDKLPIDYSDIDSRSWSIVLDPFKTNVIVTCFNNKNELGEEFFEIHDGGQYIPENFKLKTSSIEVIIEYLNKFGIYNKSINYSKK
jgi:hypothetical protein